MVAKLIRPVRDNDGRYHKVGEAVEVLRNSIEVGTHRMLIWALWADGKRIVLMPDDVEMLY